jgi:hypothetical protein
MVDVGKTYFLVGYIDEGISTMREHLALADVAAFEAVLYKLPPSRVNGALAQGPSQPPALAQAKAPGGNPASPSQPEFSDVVKAAIGPLADGKAKIVFFRPGGPGIAVSFIVREQAKELGKLGNRDFFTVDVDLGRHTYTVHSESMDYTTLQVEAGKTYFLAGSIAPGLLIGRPQLDISNVDDFEAALPNLTPSKPLN